MSTNNGKVQVRCKLLGPSPFADCFLDLFGRSRKQMIIAFRRPSGTLSYSSDHCQQCTTGNLSSRLGASLASRVEGSAPCGDLSMRSVFRLSEDRKRVNMIHLNPESQVLGNAASSFSYSCGVNPTDLSTKRRVWVLAGEGGQAYRRNEQI